MAEDPNETATGHRMILTMRAGAPVLMCDGYTVATVADETSLATRPKRQANTPMLLELNGMVCTLGQNGGAPGRVLVALEEHVIVDLIQSLLEAITDNSNGTVVVIDSSKDN